MVGLVASYALACERDQARLELQIASETARMEQVSQEMEQLKADSGNKKETCRTTSGSI